MGARAFVFVFLFITLRRVRVVSGGLRKENQNANESKGYADGAKKQVRVSLYAFVCVYVCFESRWSVAGDDKYRQTFQVTPLQRYTDIEGWRPP